MEAQLQEKVCQPLNITATVLNKLIQSRRMKMP